MSTAIIPARKGSQRIKGKNKKVFRGQPIFLYSVSVAERYGFERVIVSTDDPDIKIMCKKQGIEFHDRSDQAGRDSVGTQAVVKEVVEDMNIKPNETVCCIYATSPLLTENDLDRGYKALFSSRKIKYAVSVGVNPLQDAGNFYYMKAQSVIDDIPLFDERTAMVPLSEDRVIDINHPADWDKAEKMFDKLRGR